MHGHLIDFLIHKIVFFFKYIEWFFWLWEFLIIIYLTNTRFFFNCVIRFMNWLFRIHDFEGSMIATEKAYKRFCRELWILLVLVLIVIGLIKLL